MICIIYTTELLSYKTLRLESAKITSTGSTIKMVLLMVIEFIRQNLSIQQGKRLIEVKKYRVALTGTFYRRSSGCVYISNGSEYESQASINSKITIV